MKSPVGGVLDIFTAHAADKIICPSPHLAELVKSYCLVDDGKVCCIPNGVDLVAFDKIDDAPTSILSKYNLKKDNYVLFIGRLSSLKGVQYLIDAFKVIKKDYINLKLVIVGTGDFEGYLRNLSQGIADIVFTGYIDSLNARKILYKNSASVVVPSLYEGELNTIKRRATCAVTGEFDSKKAVRKLVSSLVSTCFLANSHNCLNRMLQYPKSKPIVVY